MTVGIITINHGTYIPDATWDGKLVVVDNPGGGTVIALPQADTMPTGLTFRIRKLDPTSNAVQVKTTHADDALNHFWKTTRPTLDANGNLNGSEAQPYGLFLNLTQQAAMITCDGVANWHMDGMTFHRNFPQSQRTVIVPSWQLTPESINETVFCDVTQAGGNIFISINQIADFCPKSFTTLGNYHAFVVRLVKVDSGAGVVGMAGAVVGGNRQFINPNNDPELYGLNRGYYYLTKQWDAVDLYINAAGIFADGSFRRRDIPGVVAA